MGRGKSYFKGSFGVSGVSNCSEVNLSIRQSLIFFLCLFTASSSMNCALPITRGSSSSVSFISLRHSSAFLGVHSSTLSSSQGGLFSIFFLLVDWRIGY